MDNQFKDPVAARLFAEVIETIAKAQEPENSELRQWDLLRCFAELQFRMNGSARCSICKATVRLKVPVEVHRVDGRVDHYDCLCTRCYEGERGQSTKVVMQVGEARVEQGPREDNRTATDLHTYVAARSKAS
jgi:hypothetical protein